MMIEDYAVLRRGELTQREAAVCAYVWRCWVDMRGLLKHAALWPPQATGARLRR